MRFLGRTPVGGGQAPASSTPVPPPERNFWTCSCCLRVYPASMDCPDAPDGERAALGMPDVPVAA